ncbi:MAG: ATP-binding protein [Alphaproteobacteria bacterium]|nr:ATP-binding protein [Alphaproteobacteria bacterium]
MLIEFSVANYRSIAERQTLSMAAPKPRGGHDRHLVATGHPAAPFVLNAACIFGPNGSGKSSFVEAVRFFKTFVSDSAHRMQHGDPIDTVPFALDSALADAPSEFEIVFIAGLELFQYGFRATRHRVVEEWLFSRTMKPHARMRTIFRRRLDPVTGTDVYEMNRDYLKGNREVWRTSTRPNGLFLSMSVQLHAAPLTQVFDWIGSKLVVLPSIYLAEEPEYYFESLVDKGSCLEILGVVGIEIVDYEITQKYSTHLDVRSGRSSSSARVDVKTIHRDRQGANVSLNLRDESDGTRALFQLAGPWLDALQENHTLIVDELHRSLHPHALRLLVSMFMDPKRNDGAQLVFTGHETSVMARNFLHRDQIWFMEKDRSATVLFPLSDFKVREFEAFQKAYLDGRFGAVPRIRDFRDD